jgi:multiple sugar transport system permease protein
MMVPVASIVLIWQVLFSFNGTVNTYLAPFGLEKIDWMKSEWSRVVILLLFLWKTLGYNMVLFLSALNNVPLELIDSSKIDGAGSGKRFFNISLIYLYPTIFFVGIMSLISSFKIFREVYLLTGDYPFDALYMLQHFMNNSFKNLDYQKLTAAAIIMALAMIAIVGVLFLAEFRLGREVEE